VNIGPRVCDPTKGFIDEKERNRKKEASAFFVWQCKKIRYYEIIDEKMVKRRGRS